MGGWVSGTVSNEQTRAGKSKSLIRWKRLKGGKRQKKAEKVNLIYKRLLAKKYLISGDVLNPESEGSA